MDQGLFFKTNLYDRVLASSNSFIMSCLPRSCFAVFIVSVHTYLSHSIVHIAFNYFVIR